jgi:hypothetical protein
LNMLRYTDLSTQTSGGIEYTQGMPIMGTFPDDQGMPSNVTVAVKWTTGLRGRSYRGRTYHIGIPRSCVEGNLVATEYVADLKDAYQTLINRFTQTGGAMVIASRQNNSVIRETGVSTPVTAVSIEHTIDSQRRRLPGRGR